MVFSFGGRPRSVSTVIDPEDHQSAQEASQNGCSGDPSQKACEVPPRLLAGLSSMGRSTCGGDTDLGYDLTELENDAVLKTVTLPTIQSMPSVSRRGGLIEPAHE